MARASVVCAVPRAAVFEHVNTAHYLTIGDHANWAFWNWINAPAGTTADRGGHEYVIVESHVHYLDELALGASVEVSTQLLDVDAKRYVLFHRIWQVGDEKVLAATNEVKFLAFDLVSRRAEAWLPKVAERLGRVRAAHEHVDRPASAGNGIAIARR
ncbi:thioesterase family protein [Actinomycetospora soli]|uniref:thioesterase family protein n=1 Tax=Actinomycetospora soli TaxID=2893887 RepID=UPI001E5E4801|nr:thioesterase family protein [Actinomycetospora soli]MCD2191389.1 thioesterase family protein [Actinomycetospora soli]